MQAKAPSFSRTLTREQLPKSLASAAEGLRPRGRSLGDHLRHRSVAYLVLLGALLLTSLASYYVTANLEAHRSAYFDETVQTTQLALSRRINTYVDAMLGGRALFAANRSVNRTQWREYTNAIDLGHRYPPGIRAFGYAERIEPEQKNAHVAAIRSEGFRTYTLRSESEQDEYLPLVYIEPFGPPNRHLLGYDLRSDRVYHTAMEQARDTGLPRATAKVNLDATMGPAGFLIYLPVYRNGQPQDTVAERRRALQGFVIGMFDADELVMGVYREQRSDPKVDLEAFDGTVLTREHILHDHDYVIHAGTSYSSRFSRTTKLDIAGRPWSLHFVTRPSFERDYAKRLPAFILLCGLAVSLVLFAFTWMLATSRALAESANARLAVANQELEAINTELEAFSYSVSHDLRAPLRGMDGFSQILLASHGDRLDAQGRHYLERIRAASQRMAQLIDDMLSLSRVTRSEMRRTTVDLSALVRQTATELQQAEPRRQVDLIIAEGVVATGDPKALRMVFDNLLGNAWKFTRKQPCARIEFGVAEREGKPVYFVRDDGVGFDMTYAGKLFGAFQRLHKENEFEGTGIGLATVQRIIHRHGGKVWAESVVGRGATFYLTL